jgi:sarcosine oxidase, subunit beta
MPYRLLKYALNKEYPEGRMFRVPERLKNRHEVVIIDGGGHGLAAAYYLARDDGITDVAVLEQSYLGSGVRTPFYDPENLRQTPVSELQEVS